MLVNVFRKLRKATRRSPALSLAVEPLEDRCLLSALLVRDINSVTVHSDPQGFTEVNGRLFFAAQTGQTGIELWTTDGTAAGTRLVKDINPGSANGLDFSFAFPDRTSGPIFLRGRA